jgi:hypothetical protein
MNTPGRLAGQLGRQAGPITLIGHRGQLVADSAQASRQLLLLDARLPTHLRPGF